MGQFCKKRPKNVGQYFFLYYLCAVFEAQIIVLLFNYYKKMKKLVLSFAVLAGMTLFACGSSDKAAEATDSVAAEATEVVEEGVVAVDSIAPDSVEVVAAEVVAE